MLSAEIIAVGSELLTPERTDTNSLWLTEKLNGIGVEVKLKTIVGDDEARLEETIRDALKRSDIVITTGGLGPTEDDITRQVSGRAVARDLVYREELVVELRERFRRWSREMPEINKRQAYVIDGADILPNPNGSAVGMMFENGTPPSRRPPAQEARAGRPHRSRRDGGVPTEDCVSMDAGVTLIVLPGPPREMQPMFENFVLPRLKKKTGGIFVKRRILRVSGMGESAVDEIIAPIYKAFKKTVQTSILFNKSEIEIHLTAKAKTDKEADATLEELAAKIADKLGTAVFALKGETMEEIIGKMLAENHKTLSVAESCTGGLIGMRITDVPGSSRYFVEGSVAYSNDAKKQTLFVTDEIINKFGAVSAETAEAMAAGMRSRSGSNYAISVTGIAGPDGGTEEKPVGTVFIGFADEAGAKSIKLMLPGDRYLIRWRSSQAALDYLRRQILKAYE